MGIGNLGEVTYDITSSMSPKPKGKFARAVDMGKRKEYKSLLKGLTRFLPLFIFRGHQEPKDSIFIAIKSK